MFVHNHKFYQCQYMGELLMKFFTFLLWRRCVFNNHQYWVIIFDLMKQIVMFFAHWIERENQLQRIFVSNEFSCHDQNAKQKNFSRNRISDKKFIEIFSKKQKISLKSFDEWMGGMRKTRKQLERDHYSPNDWLNSILFDGNNSFIGIM